jgi:hypothetical protein
LGRRIRLRIVKIMGDERTRWTVKDTLFCWRWLQVKTIYVVMVDCCSVVPMRCRTGRVIFLLDADMKRKPPIRQSGPDNPDNAPDLETLKAYRESLALDQIDSILSQLWGSLSQELSTDDDTTRRKIRAKRLHAVDPVGFLNLLQRAREECEQLRIAPKIYNRTLRLANDCYRDLLYCNARTIEELHDNNYDLYQRAMDPIIEYKMSLIARYKSRMQSRKTSESAKRRQRDHEASAGSGISETDREGTARSTRRTCVTAYTDGVPPAKIQKIDKIINDRTKSADQRLLEWDEIVTIPATASARILGQLLGVTPQRIAQTKWWEANRKGMRKEEAVRRRDKHQEMARSIGHSKRVRDLDED